MIAFVLFYLVALCVCWIGGFVCLLFGDVIFFVCLFVCFVPLAVAGIVTYMLALSDLISLFVSLSMFLFVCFCFLACCFLQHLLVCLLVC